MRADHPHGRTAVDACGQQLSTTPDAAAHYRDAVGLLADRRPGAVARLRAALAADPAFLLARATLDLVLRGGLDPCADSTSPTDSSDPPAPVTRRERQHAEILALAAAGRWARATGLAREHLRVHSGDGVLGDLLARLGRPLGPTAGG